MSDWCAKHGAVEMTTGGCPKCAFGDPVSGGPAPREPSKVQPMPDRIWVEAGREMADDGSHQIEGLEVVEGPDPNADYPYQEVAEYVRAVASPSRGTPSEALIRAADRVLDTWRAYFYECAPYMPVVEAMEGLQVALRAAAVRNIPIPP